MTAALAIWGLVVVAALLFNHGAHSKPAPTIRVLYAVSDPEEWGEAEATGPAPRP